MTKKLNLSEIVTDAGTQVRAGLNDATVVDYAEAMTDGAKFPPVIVFYDDSRHIAADGFHRIQAAKKIGAMTVECEIREGNRSEALKFALGCNAHHGLRRTNEDKRHAVTMALKEFPGLSDGALAAMCLVSNRFVGILRSRSGVNGSHLPPAPRIGKDGKVYRPTLPATRPTAAHAAPQPALAAAGGKGSPPPPPMQILDGTGCPLPTQLIGLWRRADEVQEMLTMLNRVKGALRAAQQNKDNLFAEVNFSSAQAHLDQVCTDVMTAKPYAICPRCQGQNPDPCILCKGRGLISEHRWDKCVTREDKEFRFKARRPAGAQHSNR